MILDWRLKIEEVKDRKSKRDVRLVIEDIRLKIVHRIPSERFKKLNFGDHNF
jgi:hypothetical protein